MKAAASSCLVFISGDRGVGHAAFALDPSFSWVAQVCRSSLEAGWFASRPHWHPIAAKRRSVTQPANKSKDCAKVHQPSTVCYLYVKQQYRVIMDFFSLSLSPILISNYLFKLWSFLLIACFLVEWGQTALPGFIFLEHLSVSQNTKRLLMSSLYLYISVLLSLSLFDALSVSAQEVMGDLILPQLISSYCQSYLIFKLDNSHTKLKSFLWSHRRGVKDGGKETE